MGTQLRFWDYETHLYYSISLSKGKGRGQYSTFNTRNFILSMHLVCPPRDFDGASGKNKILYPHQTRCHFVSLE